MSLAVVSVIVLALGHAATSPAFTEQGGPVTARLAVGQVWKYKSRPTEPASTLIILKLESLPTLGQVVHVAVSDLRIRNPRSPQGFTIVIPHLPLAQSAVEASVTELVGHVAEPPDFSEGYRQWQEAKGGAFKVSVVEAVEFVEKALNR
jgi:hypothetical protein